MQVTYKYLLCVKDYSMRQNPYPTLPEWPRFWEQIAHEPKGKLNFIVMLKQHNNKMTPNYILLYLDQYPPLPSLEKFLPSASRNKCRDPESVNVQSKRYWKNLTIKKCLHQMSPFRVQGTLLKQQ